MIGPRVDARVLKRLGHLLDLAARGAIDDAALALVRLHEGQDLARGAFLGLEGEPEVGPVEAAHEDARRRDKQLLDDVTPGRRVRRRGEGQGLQAPADLARETAQRQILGPEIVAPLRDAVRLVDRHHRHAGVCQHFDRVGSRQPFRRYVEQPQFAPPQQPHDTRVLGGLVAGVQAAGRDARRQRLHLVAHQGNQRRDHEGQARTHKGGKLEAE